MATGKFNVQGVHSSNDAERINLALREVWGIQEAAVQPDSGEVTFAYDERAASFRDFERAVLDLGYGVVAEGEASPIDKERMERL